MNHERAVQRMDFVLAEEKKALEYISKVSKEGLEKAIKLLSQKQGRIVTTGIGKSSFAAMKIAATLTSLGHAAAFMHPLDALHGDAGMVRDNDIILAISFSGESAEIIKLIKHLKEHFSISVISITGRSSSRLAALSDVVIELKIDKEGCPLDLAPMASVTASLVVGDMLAAGITSPEEFSAKHFAKFHPGGNIGLKLKKVGEAMWTGDKMSLVLEDTPIRDVLSEITNKKRGVAGVVNNNHEVIGSITDGDIRRFFLKHDSLNGFVARDLMSKNPRTISENASLEEALVTMEENKITSLFVADAEKKVLGLIHIHEILENTLV